MVTLHLNNPQHDISELLFFSKSQKKPAKVLFAASNTDVANADEEEYYVGPIHVTTNGVAHGIGVVASRDIDAGECLFVIPAALSADMNTVFQEWSKAQKSNAAAEESNSSAEQTVLEKISEEVLVQSMKEASHAEDDKQKALAYSFLLQLSSGEGEDARKVDIPSDNETLVKALVGKSKDPPSTPSDIDDAKLLEIIRRNAFGPDFYSYESVEKKWNSVLLESSPTASSPDSPSRLLGLYPLAAMLNHSCVPNAIRVFACGQWMIVHACSNIKQGEEIVWSYLPPVLPFPQRRQQLQERHGFVCHCVRCQKEEEAAASKSDIFVLPSNLQPFEKPGSISAVNTDSETRLQFTKDLIDWEQSIFVDNSGFSNEAKRYWKMGNVTLYMHYLNSVLMDLPNHNPKEVEALREAVLKTAMELHFAFLSCSMASTEHISVLHLCYELVAVMHSRAADQSKTLPKVKFWTEQLKRAHMTRYGNLGANVEKIRGVMKHTQLVLRNQNGLAAAQFDFI